MSVVLTDHDDGVAVITLNRPERRNGVTVELCRRLYDAVREVAASAARVVVLCGAGNDFCVGADIGGEGSGGPDGQDKAPTLESLGLIHHAATLLHTMPQVTVAAVDGGCAGAGMGYATSCDFRFGTAEARFNTAFLNVGVPGDMGLAWNLNRIVGGARARELLFFPEKLTGAQALEIGLVTRIFPRETLHRDVMALARGLADRDPFALRMMKANMISAEELPIAGFIDIETARQVHATSRPDMAERMAALHRKAQNKG